MHLNVLFHFIKSDRSRTSSKKTNLRENFTTKQGREKLQLKRQLGEDKRDVAWSANKEVGGNWAQTTLVAATRES